MSISHGLKPSGIIFKKAPGPGSMCAIVFLAFIMKPPDFLIYLKVETRPPAVPTKYMSMLITLRRVNYSSITSVLMAPLGHSSVTSKTAS